MRALLASGLFLFLSLLVPVATVQGQCFRRGDSNCDLRFDLSDPVHTLNWLFIGGGKPCCIDGADSNDDGLVNISDPIFSLGFLFLGGSAPPAPFPGCGRDASQDALTCLEYPGCPQSSDCLLPNHAPSLDPISDRTVVLGDELVLEAHASDPDGDALEIALLVGPEGMTASAAGEIRWRPSGDQVGAHDVSVAVEDSRGAADFESFSVLVRRVNGAPVARGESYSVRMGETLRVDSPGLLENDSDPDGDPLATELVAGPNNGTLDLRADGSFRYTPTRPGFDGLQRRRAVNENLTILAAPELLVSTQGINCPTRGCDSEAAADDELGTSWLSVAGDAAPFYEVVFEDEDVTVREVRIFGNREAPAGFDVLEGVLTIQARGGNQIFSSGVVAFPEPDRDLVIPVGVLEGAYRVRLAITLKEADRVGISEIQVIGDGTVRALEVRQKWVWERSAVLGNYTSVLSTPTVVDLDGDARPEVVFASGQGVANSGYVRAVRGSDGSEVFTTSGTRPVASFTSIAVGDIDQDHRPEIVAYTRNGTLVVFEHDGSFKWESERLVGVNWGAVAIADLDADGSPEILLGNQVVDAAGKIRWTGEKTGGLEIPVAADIDLDGKLEVLDGATTYRSDGSILWFVPTVGHGYSAVGNFDGDPFGEVVIATPLRVELYDQNGTRLWSYAGNSESMGAPTIADFDGDGKPEIGVARRSKYVVVDSNGTALWQRQIQDNSSSQTGSSVFDFDGDGVAEVVYRDEVYLRVFRGTDGRVLLRKRFHSATANESPIVADVDNDGHADLVVPGDNPATLPANPPPGVKSGVYVYTGVRDDWVRARTVWNEHGYHVTNVLIDGTVPVHERANWLVPGLNHFRLNDFLPEEEEGADRFTYRATDGSIRSQEATVLVDVRHANSPPEIVAPLRATATRGFLYLELVRAVDPDRDDMTFALAESPPGMTIDVNGILRWIPDAPGDFPVSVRVEDDDQALGFARVIVHVVEPVKVPDVLGLAEAEAQARLAGAGLGSARVASSTHPTVAAGRVASQDPPAGASAEPGSAIAILVSLGPSPDDLDGDADSFSRNQGDCDDGDSSIFPGATETPGDGIDQDCDGEDTALEPIELVVEPSSLTLVAGETAAVEAFALNAEGGSQRVTASAGWRSNAPAATVDASGFVTAAAAGSAQVRAAFHALTGSVQVTVIARAAGDDTPPVAEIASPGSSASILGPTEIRGTASDAHFVRYELGLAPAGATDFTPIGTGSTPVVGGTLGTLDPTVLQNGLYDLRLTVIDAGGNRKTASVPVQVEGEQKVGLFRIAFTDLVVPLPGLPITLRRIYDSRDKETGDFGIGWKLDLQSVRIRTSRVLGTGWVVQKSGLAYRLLPEVLPAAIVQGSGGLFEQFDLVITPSASAIIPLQSAQASFRPREGSDGTLEILDGTGVVFLDPQPGRVQLYNDDTFDVFDPKVFRYTSPGGLTLVIDRTRGLQSARDPNGNTLTFNAGSIEHSAGASVTIERDASGRIVSIKDLNENVQTYEYAASGDLKAHVDAEGAVTRFAYGRRHDLVRIQGPNGAYIRNEYDEAGRLISSTDGAGNRIELQHDLDSRTDVETDPRGSPAVLKYDENGNVLSRERLVTIEGASVVARETFLYDSLGNEVEEKNADGLVTRRAFQGGDVTDILRDPGGLRIAESFQYDEKGNVVERRDPAVGALRFEYDSRGNAVGYVDSAGNRTTLVHDAAGRLIRRQDPAGGWSSFSHDSLGRVSRVEDFDAQGQPLGREDSTYDAMGNAIAQTRFRDGPGGPEALVTRFTYDGNNRRLTATDPLGGITRLEYEPSGRVRSVTDPRGHATRFAYGPTGLLERTDFADGSFETQKHDEAGNVIERTDAGSRTNRFRYDELSRLVETTGPDGATFRRVYSPGGRLVATVDAKGKRTDYEHDAAGRETRRIDPEVLDGVAGAMARPETRMEYDAAGRVVAVVDPTQRRTEVSYDVLGRLTEVLHPDGSKSARSFDSLGRLATTTNEDGLVTRFGYDGLGRLVSVTLPPARASDPPAVTSYAYDAAGNLTQQTDALGRKTRFEHDAMGRLLRRTLPGGQSESFTYDPAGNILSRTDFAGHVTAFEHDVRNRLTARRFEDGSSHELRYQPSGFRTAAVDSAGETLYESDENGQLESITLPDGLEIAYGRDANGNVTSIATAARTVEHVLDAMGRLAGVVSPEGTHEYLRDLAGRLVGILSPNGVDTSIELDAQGRVTGISHAAPGGGTLDSFHYTLSPSGLRTRVEEADGSVETYAYDAQGRLVDETRTGRLSRHVSYELDAVGNRLRRVADGVETRYAYDVNDRLLSRTGATFTYDANGNRTSKIEGAGRVDYVWDQLDRLVEARTSRGATRWTFDADGNRIRVAGPDGTRSYLVDSLNPTGLSQALEERDGAGTLVAAHTYGGSLLASSTGAGVLFHHQDAHGSTRLLTPSDGARAAALSYDAFGRGVEGDAAATSHRYAGERLDAELGLYDLRARRYDPEEGIFLGMDPLLGGPNDPTSLHPYLYARGSPVSFIDPTGLSPLADVTITQSIRNGMEKADLAIKAVRVCKLQGQLQLIDGVFLATHLTTAIFMAAQSVGLLSNPGSRQYVGQEVVIFKYTFESSGTSRKPGELVDMDIRVNPGKPALVVGGTKAPDTKFSVEFSSSGVSSSAGLSPELKTIKGCGAEIAKLELKLRFGGSVSKTGFKARASVGIELKTFGDALKQTFPWFAIEIGNPSGFSSAAAFNVRLAEMTPDELAELFRD